MGTLLKIGLLVGLVLLLLSWLRQGRKPPPPATPPSAPPRGTPPGPLAEMVACRHCDLRLPRAEALSGRAGLYCSEAHRRAAGDAAG